VETVNENFNKLKQHYGVYVLSRSQVFKWYKRFSESCEFNEGEPHSGRISTSQTDNNVQLVLAVVQSDSRLAVRMIAGELNLNHTTVRQI
jgi:hypothetical protein